MITQTTLENGLIRTVSDTYLIKKIGTNEIYSEAIDIPNSGYEYEETTELLPSENPDNIEPAENVE